MNLNAHFLTHESKIVFWVMVPPSLYGFLPNV